MFHHVARAERNSVLFRTHHEAAALWRSLTDGFPELTACCLMPDHVHLLLPHSDEEGRFGRVKSGFARWRNAHRGVSGAVWAPSPAPERVTDDDKQRRAERYVHLNPCRRRLVDDPLSWPWSTHRDRVGLAAPPVVPPSRDPERFHHYVSGDPTVAVEGTPLPTVRGGAFGWQDVLDAVGNICRDVDLDLSKRGPVRSLIVQTAWAFGVGSRAELARLVGVDLATAHRLVARAPPRYDPGPGAFGACFRAVGDPRFGALPTGDLRRLRRWEGYRGRW